MHLCTALHGLFSDHVKPSEDGKRLSSVPSIPVSSPHTTSIMTLFIVLGYSCLPELNLHSNKEKISMLVTRNINPFPHQRNDLAGQPPGLRA